MHRLSRIWVALVLGLWGIVGSSIPMPWAATFHVTTSGSDSNSCSSSSPCRTIQHGIAVMSSGDTLTIHAGTYNEYRFTPPSNTTIQGNPGEIVTIRPTSGSNGPGFELAQNTDHITIRNLILDGTNDIFSYGMLVQAADVLIEDVEIHHQRNQGIALYRDPHFTSQRATLRRVHVHHGGTGPSGCNGTTPRPGYCHGVYVYTNDNVIDGGEFDHSNGWGIQGIRLRRDT